MSWSQLLLSTGGICLEFLCCRMQLLARGRRSVVLSGVFCLRKLRVTGISVVVAEIARRTQCGGEVGWSVFVAILILDCCVLSDL